MQKTHSVPAVDQASKIKQMKECKTSAVLEQLL
jgi:hypothetical protein